MEKKDAPLVPGRRDPKPDLSGTLESYLETVHELQAEFGAVRVTDLAAKMGCKVPSATHALRRLGRLELVRYQAYHPVTLTKKGLATVQRLRSHHSVLADFLENILGLPGEFAQAEACRLEHRISTRTLNRLKRFMEFQHAGKNEITLGKFQREFAAFLAGFSD